MKTFASRSRGPHGPRHRPHIARPSTAPRSPSGLQGDRAPVRHALSTPRLQGKLAVGAPDDAHEREADRVADQIVGARSGGTSAPAASPSPPSSTVQRSCGCGGGACSCGAGKGGSGDEEMRAKRVGGGVSTTSAADGSFATGSGLESRIRALRGGGRPLPDAARSEMEPRFGHHFGAVRVHEGPEASLLTRAVSARAFTLGNDIVFGQGELAPTTPAGRHLLAHELTHVVQQGAARASDGSEMGPATATAPVGRALSQRVQRQPEEVDIDIMDDPRRHPAGAPKATSCKGPEECPSHFCEPYESESYAQHQLNKMRPMLLAGIAAAVGLSVVPFWSKHLAGGAAPEDISSKFGSDFTASKTTRKATETLDGALRKSLESSPPRFPQGKDTVTVDLATRIPRAIAHLGDPWHSDRMDFDVIRDVAGNLAGGIGKDQTTCKAGAKPSPFDDERTAKGTATVTKDAAGDLVVTPAITFVVKDTVDLCPGNCGADKEQLATIPISQFEATGIAGDVPFTVEFPAPATSFKVPLSTGKGASVGTPSQGILGAGAQIAGQVTLGALSIGADIAGKAAQVALSASVQGAGKTAHGELEQPLVP